MISWRWFTAIAALVLAAAAPSQAQSVIELRGRVIDSVTGAPLVDAIVRLPAMRRYTLTNSTGGFVLSDVPRGIQTVVIVQLGYGEVVRHIDVEPNATHVFRLTPEPIRLEGLIAADTRRVQRILNDAAQTRATDMGRNRTTGWPPPPPVFWNTWDRQAIVGSGIDEPILFLQKGPPRLAIRKCSGLYQSADRLCVSVPFDGQGPPGFTGWPAVWTPRVTNTERLRQGGRIRITPPSTVHAAVFLDDRPVGAIENLARYTMDDFHRIETYGYRGERGIRLYTEGYLRLVAAGIIKPDTYTDPETFEFRRARDDYPEYNLRCCLRATLF